MLAKAFDERLQRGIVLRLQDYNLPSGQKRDKFFLVLNRDCAAPVIHHFLTTSKVSKFQALPWGRSEGVPIPAGTYPKMPLETMIDCHDRLPPLDREALMDAYCDGACDIVGELDAMRLGQVDLIITKSRIIPPATKRLILP